MANVLTLRGRMCPNLNCLFEVNLIEWLQVVIIDFCVNQTSRMRDFERGDRPTGVRHQDIFQKSQRIFYIRSFHSNFS